MILIARGFLIEYGQKMIKTSQHIIETVESLGIDTVYHEHDAVFTVEESKKIKNHIDGCGTKNLFLKNKKGVMVLVLAKHDTQVDLKGLSKRIGGGSLSFGKPDLLDEVLGVKPGSVTPLSLINDKDNRRISYFVLDKAITKYDYMNCHPMVNTATVVLKGSDLLKFIDHCGHEKLTLDLSNP